MACFAQQRVLSCSRNETMVQAGNSHICAHCGTANGARDQFCSNCGYSLAGGPPDMTIVSSAQVQTISTPIHPTGRRFTGALTQGTLLDGRYRILKLVGKGGFGAVYKATDTRFPSHPVVAIKEMSDAQLSPSEKAKAITDFKNEADLLVKLDHDNLPDVSNVFDDGDKIYLVMEFIEGETLEKHLEDRDTPLNEPMVMGWALQLCSVLHYLHNRKPPIIFRDLKPSNVMITADGKIKLIDFGIARVFKSAASKDTTLLGSHGYAPLEQYGRGQSDARTDVYALGATLYHLLTNELPADSPSRRVHPSIFVPPRQLNPLLSQKTEDVVLKAMADEPQHRFQSAAEMYQAVASTGLAAISNPLFTIGSGGLTGSQPGIYPNTPQTLATTPPPPPPVQAGQVGTVSQPGAGTSSPSARGTGGAPPVAPPVRRQPPTTPPARSGGISRRGLLIAGGVVVAGAAAYGLYALRPQGSSTPTSPVGNLIEVSFTYSTEKEAWLKDAIEIFNQKQVRVGNRPITIKGTPEGSVRAKENILNQKISPVAWSPASDLELNQLIYAWQNKHNDDITFTSGEFASKFLVQSPIVFAIWSERAEILKAHYKTTAIDWPTIQDAVKKNSWKDVGGQENWGPVKLGHTRPDQSNSGLLTVTLMAYSHFNKARNLTVDDVKNANFLTYLDTFEQAVQKFGRSSGTYFDNEVVNGGPANYDIVMTYENLVLTNQEAAKNRQQQALSPFYPQRNVVSNHPFAILKGEGITEEQQQAAMQFRDFLLTDEMQQKAVQKGFRPGDSPLGIDIDVPNNPFKQSLTGTSIPATLPNLAQGPNGEVVEELIKQWLAKYNLAPTALSNSPAQNQPEGISDNVLL